jgi:hypothetical protein
MGCYQGQLELRNLLKDVDSIIGILNTGAENLEKKNQVLMKRTELVKLSIAVSSVGRQC